MKEYRSNQGSLIGVFFIIIGALFLVDTFSNWSFGNLLADWWPLIFVIIAITKFQNQERGSGLVFLIIGAIFLLFTHGVLEWDTIWRLWPLMLVFIGLSLVFKGRRSSWGFVDGSTYDSDFIHSNAIFGGAEHGVTSQNFKGGEMMSMFGGIELDLRDAKISGEGCKLNATAIFGGIEINVPKDWKVIVRGTPIFGGVENRSRGQGGDKTKEVELHCTVIFGGIEIK